MRRHNHYNYNEDITPERKVFFAPEGDGEGSENSGGEGSVAVSREEFENLKRAYEEKNGELESMRDEILSPDYLDYIAEKERRTKEPQKKEESNEGRFKGMTPEQIYNAALEDAKRITESEAKKIREEMTNAERASIQKEIKEFAKSTPDFEQYRPIMHGLSLDPKNSDLSLRELYDLSKKKVRELSPTQTTDEDRKKRRAMSGERPGANSESFKQEKKYKEMSADDIAREAMDEVRDKLGDFPEL